MLTPYCVQAIQYHQNKKIPQPASRYLHSRPTPYKIQDRLTPQCVLSGIRWNFLWKVDRLLSLETRARRAESALIHANQDIVEIRAAMVGMESALRIRIEFLEEAVRDLEFGATETMDRVDVLELGQKQ